MVTDWLVIRMGNFRHDEEGFFEEVTWKLIQGGEKLDER